MKSKYDKDFKAKVIDDNVVKNLLETKRQLEREKEIIVDCDGEVSFANRWLVYSSIERHDNDSFDCAYLLARSKVRKALKVREKIGELILRNDAVFLTLTFRDEVLESTSQATRRRYVSRFLKDVSGQYCANIDFSPDIGREHYHAVITRRVDLKSWSYGFAYAEKCRCHKSDLTRVSKYITKLTAHALKVDATRLIYSRM